MASTLASCIAHSCSRSAARSAKAELSRTKPVRALSLEVRQRQSGAERCAGISALVGRHVICRAVDGGGPAAATTEAASKTDVAWAKAAQMLADGEVFEGTVMAVKSSGLAINCWGISGFMPFSLLAGDARPEKGEQVRGMFQEVDRATRRLILSQRKLQRVQLAKQIQAGDVVECEVRWIEAYGVFVNVAMPGGATLDGMIHKSQLSWGVVATPESVVKVGDVIRCKVLDSDHVNGRVVLSLKEMKQDPLTQTVESMFVSESDVEWNESATTISGLDEVLQKLQEVEGVSKVELGRQGDVRGVVSQELEFWLTKEMVDDHYTIIARAGSTIQEVMVYCTLDKPELKDAIDAVLTRINKAS